MNPIQRVKNSRFFPIFLLTFINGLSMMMLYPVLPFIIKFYGQSEVVLGILFGTFSLFQFLASPVLGTLSDKYGRKQVLIWTQAGTMLSWLILAGAYFTQSVEVFGFALLPIIIIFISRIFDGITGGNNSVAQAMIADLTSVDERAKIFGLNGAVFGLALIIGPALGALSMTFGHGYLGTALLGFVFSALTLGVMMFVLKESLPEKNRKHELKLSFRELNVFSQIKKWRYLETIRYTLVMKLFMFVAFIGYTSTSTLYLIDYFEFSSEKVGYYLTFTGMFLIFHQSVSIRVILERLKDRKSLLLGLTLMGVSFLGMGLVTHIVPFTILYFFAVMGIALCFTTLGALASRCVDERNQGEIMGMMTGVESFISIGAPVLMTYIYSQIDFSIYILIAFLPLFAVLLNRVFYSSTEFLPANTKKEA